MNTRERNCAIQALAETALNDHDEFDLKLLPAFESLTGRQLIDYPHLDDEADSLARELRLLQRLVDGTVSPFDIDERLGNNDADYLTALEQQSRRVDDERFTLLYGRGVRACIDCQRTSSNYEPALDGLYCADHADARDRATAVPLHLVSVR